jgi:hypothetical protein
MTPAARHQDGEAPRWRAGLPRKGWACLAVVDHEEPEFTCQLCGYNAVRFVHVMAHDSHPGELRVGCVCAGHLEEDYAAPRQRERVARNAASRRARVRERHRAARAAWVDLGWRTSAKGNLWRGAGAGRVVILEDTWRPGWWKAAIGDQFGSVSHPTAEAAMLDVFDVIFPLDRLLRDVSANGRSTIKLPGERGFR